ncbi:MAG: hypothetical protein ACJ71N_00195 [Terriglobales bacterium]
MKLLQLWIVAIALLILPRHALGQGCSMCKTSSEAAAAEQQRSLNHGILILALPSVVIFAGLSIFAFRYRSRESASASKPTQAENTDLL